MKNKRPSQALEILQYLQEGSTITPLEALEKFGCMRLASRINELRNEGHLIIAEKFRVASGKIVTRYSI